MADYLNKAPFEFEGKTFKIVNGSLFIKDTCPRRKWKTLPDYSPIWRSVMEHLGTEL